MGIGERLGKVVEALSIHWSRFGYMWLIGFLSLSSSFIAYVNIAFGGIAFIVYLVLVAGYQFYVTCVIDDMLKSRDFEIRTLNIDMEYIHANHAQVHKAQINAYRFLHEELKIVRYDLEHSKVENGRMVSYHTNLIGACDSELKELKKHNAELVQQCAVLTRKLELTQKKWDNAHTPIRDA